MAFAFHSSDLAELTNLLKIAQRPNVRHFLSAEIQRIRTQSTTSGPAGLNLASQLSSKKSTRTSSSTAKPAQPIKPTKPPAAIPGAKYIVPPSFAWDQSDAYVTVYVRDLIGVGSLDKSKVTVDFTKESFDLCVHDLEGKNYRVLRDNLDKDIVPGESKLKIKANKILIKMKKIPGEYGSEHWSNLTSKKSKKEKKSKAKKKEDPMGGIMDLMKDMYDTGDEKMKETIGKAMYDSRMGKKNSGGGDDAMGGGMGGMGGAGGFGDM